MPEFLVSNITKRRSHLLCFLFVLLAFSIPTRAQFVKGADVGWLSQMEATGFRFYNDAGVQTECLQILKDKEINTIRLRVWVNPSTHKTNGHCSKKETVVMAMRAKSMGMKVMINFHFSDSWADPSKQTKPAAWSTHTFSQLLDDVYYHTYDVLDTLKQCGVIPEWVQIGNEIRGGMLWPDGKTSNWSNLGKLLNKGYDAAKAVDSSIQVVIHLEGGNENAKCRSFFDNAKAQGVRYDVIGLSYYPYWISPTGHKDFNLSINDLANNMNDLAARYGKGVMVVEVGGLDTQVQDTYNMLVAVIEKTKAVPGGKGLGVIYWEPQGERNWSGGYPLSCWYSNGKPTAAINAFLTPVTGTNPPDAAQGFNFYPNPFRGGLLNFEFTNTKSPRSVRLTDMNGRLIKQQKMDMQSEHTIFLSLSPGIYFVQVDEGKHYEIKKLVIL